VFIGNNQRNELNLLLKAIEETEGAGECYNFPDAFYPDHRNGGNGELTKWAVAICKDCPLQRLCGEYAVKWELDGIWGGLVPAERERIRRGRGITLPKYDPEFFGSVA
jgi:hypothetical protein